MPMLTNSPPVTVLRLEQNQSYSLGVYCKTSDTRKADLTGHTINFVMGKLPRFGGDIVINQLLELTDPEGGYAQLFLQAADLELDAGTYLFAMTILTPEGYTGLLVKGEVEVQSNVDFVANGTYSGLGNTNSITLTMQRNNSLHLHVLPLVTDLSPYVVDAEAAAEAAEAAQVAAEAAQAAAEAAAAAAVSINLTIGTVTTLTPGSSATASITGTFPNLLLNLGIPAGATGAQGIQGIQGITGNTGPPGRKTLTFRWPAGVIATGIGTTKIYNDTGVTWTIISVRANVDIAPSGSSLIVDVNKNSVTIFTTQGNRPTIASGGFTSGKVTNMNVTSVADGEFLTVDVDQIGSPAAELTVQMVVD